MSFVWNFSVDGGTDFTLNIWSAIPSAPGTYYDFSAATAELRCSTNSATGVTSTVIDIVSEVSNDAGSITLGAIPLSVYDPSSSPPVSLTIPANQYWTVKLAKATTTTYAGQILCYNFFVTLGGATLKPASGEFDISYVIPAGS